MAIFNDEALRGPLGDLFRARRWQLVAPDDPDFVKRVVSRLRQWHPQIDQGKPPVTEALIHQAAISVYSEILFVIFGDVSAERYERAWIEVGQTAWGLLRRGVDGDDTRVADLMQQTILRTATRYPRVKSPDTFIAFVYWQARAVLTDYRRKTGREIGDDDQTVDGQDSTQMPSGLVVPGPEQEYADDDLSQQILAGILECMKGRLMQAIALIGRFYRRLEYSELATLLGVTATRVRHLVSEALTWLRGHCSEVHQLLRQFQGQAL